MAQKSNLGEHWFNMSSTALAAATRRDLTAETVYMPETTSRTIRSVILEVTADQTDAVATSLTSALLGIKIDAVAFSDATVTDTVANSGEHSTWGFQRDVTSYFVTNYTGASHSVQVGVSFGAVGTINIVARLIFEYEFDDASQDTRLYTARIPLDGSTTTLTSTLAEIGTTNQIPIFTSTGRILPEASVTIRNLRMVVETNRAGTAVTDWQVGTQIDSATEVLSGLIEGALNSATMHRHVFDLSGIDTTVVHAWKMRTTVTAYACWQQCVIYVTYEYSHTSSTSWLISRMLPFTMSGPTPTAAQGEDKYRIRFNVPEPATLALQQSGIVAWSQANAAANLVVAIGTQADRTYTHTLGSLTCGQYPLSHRLDAGAAAGTGGLTLAAGPNTIDVAMSAATAGVHWTVTGWVYLNYHCGTHSAGKNSASHPTCWSMWDYAADAVTRVAAQNRDVVIPETNYRIDAVAVDLQCIFPGFSGHGWTFMARVESGEWGSSWRTIWAAQGNAGGETCMETFILDATRWFKRHPDDTTPDALDIETASRQWRHYITTSSYVCGRIWVCYASLTYTVAGTWTSYSGDGSGISVDIFDPDDRFVRSVTTSAGGGWTAQVYDARAGYYAAAQQDATHVGRTATGTPT